MKVRGSIGGLLLGIWALASSAPLAAQVAVSVAGTVVLADGDGTLDERGYAVTTELGLRALALEIAPAPSGEDWASRERSARALALSRGALAALWIEREQAVCAVALTGPARCATLPRSPATVELRVLAVLFGSVLDEALTPPEPAIDLVPRIDGAPSSDEDVSIAAHATHDGEPHPYALTESSVGAVWSPGAQANIAHLVQRVGAGALIGLFRVEIMLGMGIDQSLDGSYEYAFTVDGQAFLAASLPVEGFAIDLGGVIGGVGHEHVAYDTLSANGMMTALVVGAAIGLHAPDTRAAFPFRARLEAGLFARPEPGRAAPFTHVALGVGFW